MYLSSGGLTRFRRSAQYAARAGSSGDAAPLTGTCRTMPVQENLTRQAPLSRSPDTQWSFLNLLNLPKYRLAIQRFGLSAWRHVAHLQVSFHM